MDVEQEEAIKLPHDRKLSSVFRATYIVYAGDFLFTINHLLSARRKTRENFLMLKSRQKTNYKDGRHSANICTTFCLIYLNNYFFFSAASPTIHHDTQERKITWTNYADLGQSFSLAHQNTKPEWTINTTIQECDRTQTKGTFRNLSLIRRV